MANTPNVAKNLTLGKGVLYFNKLDQDTGLYEGFRDLGNATSVALNISPEKLAHYSSRGGLKVKDKEIVKELALKMSFNLDEPNVKNLGLTFMADEEEVVQSDATDATYAIAGVTLGRWYSVGAKNITVLTDEVTDTDTVETTYALGTDFTVDSKNGRVFIPYTSSIPAESDITVTYSAAASTFTRLKALNQTQVEGVLQFLSDNPAGENYDLMAWRSSLMPTGDVNLISDDWMSLGYEAEILKDEAGHPDSPYMTIDTLII